MNKYITVKVHELNAGIGHRFSNFIVPLILANRYNLKYVYQPIVNKDESHIYQMAPIKKWNDFLNFGENELTIENLSHCIKINIPWVQRKEAKWFHPQFAALLNSDFAQNDKLNILYEISENDNGQFIEIDWKFYGNNDLKIKYNNSLLVKNFKNYFSKNYLNCAIHLRREDVTENAQYDRWKSLDYYLSIIENLEKIEINFARPFMYHIYTSKISKEELKKIIAFKNIKDLNMEFHIDEDLFSTFYHLTKADIFVNGQGSFSLMANYLTDAIKLTTPWIFHWNNFSKDIKDIIEINKDGVFDENKLMETIK
jgi:hypothetical protein